MLQVTPIVSQPQGAAVHYINVPIRLLQESSRDSLQMAMTALSVAIKCYTASSCYRWQSYKKFRKDFTIGKELAHKLIDHIEESPLFLVRKDREGRLVSITARSLKLLYGEMVQYSWRPMTRVMMVAKVRQRQRDELRLCDIREELKELLMLYDIHAKQRSDEFITKEASRGRSLSHAPSFLSVNGMAKVNACSARTVIRRTRRWEKEGIVDITRYPLIRVCDDMERATEAERRGLFAIGNMGYYRYFNNYQIKDWELRKRFQHIIYGHVRRCRPISARPQKRQLTFEEKWEEYDVYAKY